MIIAIDGPAASGKGTLAKGLAHHLSFEHLDTGLFYRAFPDIKSKLTGTPDEKIVMFVDLFHGFDKNFLRNEAHGQRAAMLASEPDVRSLVTRAIRREAALLRSRKAGVVVDGRDIGTVVFPEADVKLFVTASVESRAQRRFLEMQDRGEDVTLAEIEEDLRRRDERDRNRTEAPLIPAEDAYILDTSDLGKNEAIVAAIEIVKANIGR